MPTTLASVDQSPVRRPRPSPSLRRGRLELDFEGSLYVSYTLAWDTSRNPPLFVIGALSLVTLSANLTDAFRGVLQALTKDKRFNGPWSPIS
jgi:hypothetical protein